MPRKIVEKPVLDDASLDGEEEEISIQPPSKSTKKTPEQVAETEANKILRAKKATQARMRRWKEHAIDTLAQEKVDEEKRRQEEQAVAKRKFEECVESVVKRLLQHQPSPAPHQQLPAPVAPAVLPPKKRAAPKRSKPKAVTPAPPQPHNTVVQPLSSGTTDFRSLFM